MKRVNGDVFTTFVRNDLPTFTIHEILTMMKIESGEFHIVSGVREKKRIVFDDVADDLSL